MKTIRGLICAGVLLAAGNCLAFAPGNQVQVIDVSSPYYLRVATVVSVQDAGTPGEVDTVIMLGSPVDFDASQLKRFAAVRPSR